MTTAVVAVTFDEMSRLSEAVAASGLFGMKNASQALALMAIAQAEGQHPALAARDYHVVQGRPVMKANAMLARFQNAGGKMRYIERTDQRVEAEFTHPQGGSITVDWDIERAKRAGLAGKDNWKNYPRQMLTARVISEGITAVFPGATGGLLTPEEAIDVPEPVERDITPEAPKTGVAALQARVTELVNKVTGEVIEAAPAPDEAPIFSDDEILAMADRSQDKDDWAAVLDMARNWPEEKKQPLRKKYDAWKVARKAQAGEAAVRG